MLFALLYVSAFDVQPMTFNEASTLPESEVIKRALGPIGQLFPEVQRPYMGGLPPVTSYALSFASQPKNGGLEGLCYADTLTLTYVSRDEAKKNITNEPMTLRAFQVDRKYAYLPFAGLPVDRSCAEAGKVFESPNRIFLPADERAKVAANSAFFYFQGFNSRGHQDAQFAIRALKTAQAKCGVGFDQCSRISGPVEANLKRIWAVEVERCPDQPTLCVTARIFGEPDGSPGTTPELELLIRTGSRDLEDSEIKVIEVKKVTSEIITH